MTGMAAVFSRLESSADEGLGAGAGSGQGSGLGRGKGRRVTWRFADQCGLLTLRTQEWEEKSSLQTRFCHRRQKQEIQRITIKVQQQVLHKCLPCCKAAFLSKAVVTWLPLFPAPFCLPMGARTCRGGERRAAAARGLLVLHLRPALGAGRVAAGRAKAVRYHRGGASHGRLEGRLRRCGAGSAAAPVPVPSQQLPGPCASPVRDERL